LLLVVIACGKPHQATPLDSGGGGGSADGAVADGDLDGTPVDVMPDAKPDAPPLPVIPPEYECDVTQAGTVKVHTWGANTTLLIHDVFGTLVARMTTASNVVDLTVPGCGSVTAVDGTIFYTVTYVRGGDELWVGTLAWTAGPSQGPARMYIDTPVAGAPSYFILGSEVSASLVANDPSARDITWTNRSLNGQGLATFAVHPTDPVSGLPVVDKYHVFENVSLANAIQSPLHLTSWSSLTKTVDLRLQFAQPVQVYDLGLTNWHDGHGFWARYAEPHQPATTHDYSITVSSYGSGLVLSVPFRVGTAGNVRGYSQVIPMPQAPVVLDLSQALLPEILSMTIAPSPSRPTISWTLQAGPAVTPDLTLLRVLGPIEWRIALPPGLTSYQLPEVPPDLAANQSTINPGVSLIESTDYSGYAAARGRFVETFVFGPERRPMGWLMRGVSFGNAAF
jgi:hypothetical protein